MPPAWQHFFSRVARVIRLPDGFMLASGRNTTDETCTVNQEGATRWTRGSGANPSFLETCLYDGSGYSWATGTTGGTVGLAAHIADTSTHGTTGDIVGTTDSQTLTNKTLTSPAISSPTGLVKGDVGLGNVDNTSDATKNAAAVTLTNKTLTAPVIADFTNMAHDHLDADDGGTLSASAIASGTMATARLGAGAADSSVFLRGDQTWSALPIAPGVWPAAFVDEFGAAGTGNGQFTGLRGIAVHRTTGDVFTASDDRIQRFSANGTFEAVLATVGSGNGQVDDPEGLAVDMARNSLWIADTDNLRAQEILTTDGSFLDEIDVSPNAPHDVSFSPTIGLTVAVGSTIARAWAEQGREYSITSGEHRVIVTDGVSPLYYIGDQLVAGSGKGELDTPVDMAIDELGNVWIVDQGNHRVQVFSEDGIFLGEFGSFGTGDGEFDTPTAIAITTDFAYVADDGNDRVQIFANPSGARAIEVTDDRLFILDNADLSKRVRLETSGITTGTTRTLTVPDKNGTISTASRYRVQILSYNGVTVTQWSNQPAAATELFGLADFRHSANLADFTEFRIQARIAIIGHTTATLHGEYTTDTTGASGWADLGTQATQEITIATLGERIGAWTAMASGAQTDVLVRVVGVGGNATADPFPTNVSLEFR